MPRNCCNTLGSLAIFSNCFGRPPEVLPSFSDKVPKVVPKVVPKSKTSKIPSKLLPRHSMCAIYAAPLTPKTTPTDRHIWHTWSVWVIHLTQFLQHPKTRHHPPIPTDPHSPGALQRSGEPLAPAPEPGAALDPAWRPPNRSAGGGNQPGSNQQRWKIPTKSYPSSVPLVGS